jgi:tRNA(Arg) A34 adenosine deaminase TadA
MARKLDDADRRYLQLAVELSCGYREDRRRGPFGAIVVVDGEVAGRGINQVVELHDPIAHAEVMALRSACDTLGRHLLEDGVLYSSSEPCPMCLAACYWTCVPRIVYAAATHDVADSGLPDLAIYNELNLPAEYRSIREDTDEGDLRKEAVSVLREWRDRYRGSPAS